jgi:hypothetical protein
MEHNIALEAKWRYSPREWVAFERLSLPRLPNYDQQEEQWYIPEVVFREYNAITEVKNESWSCAAEERVTFFECELNPKCGWLPPHLYVNFVLTLLVGTIDSRRFVRQTTDPAPKVSLGG